MAGPRFSISDALEAALRLPARKPASVFVWGLMLTAVSALGWVLLLPIFATLPLNDSQAAMEQYSEQVMAAGVGMNALQLLSYVVMLLIYTAAVRAALWPREKPGFFHLRLGMDEVRVAVVVIAVFIGWYFAVVVLAMLGVGLGLAVYAASRAATAPVVIAYGLAVFVAAVWAWCRVSLIAPASLILRKFAVEEGWRIARGQVWKLVGLTLLTWVLYMVLSLVALAVGGLILLVGWMAQGLQWPGDVQTLGELGSLLRAMAPALAVALVPSAFLSGWLMAIWSVPSAIAARQLLDGAPVPPQTNDNLTEGNQP
jgi:hypothetical protein